MNTNAHVSVVIPLYNKANYVKRAIDSVLSQTFPNFELIVVDDGSTDDSAEIVRSCRDARIRLVAQENAGVSAARNRGVQEASSELIAFLDADDRWLPDFLESVLRIRVRFPQASVWASSYSTIGSDGEAHQPDFADIAVLNPDGGLIDYFQSAGPWMPVHASALMLQKSALVKVGGFPEGIRCGEDWDTWTRLALRYPIAWSPQVNAVLYQDAGNRTDNYCYTGIYPFANSLRMFLQEAGPDFCLPERVYQHVTRFYMRLLKGNWLAGRRTEMAEIIRDCRGVKGFRLKCLLWSCLKFCPYCIVIASWKLRQYLSGRNTIMPTFRDVRRP